MKMQRCHSGWLIVLLMLIAQLNFAGMPPLAGAFRWSGAQLQFNPQQFYGSSAPDQWFNAYFDSSNQVIVQYGGESGDHPVSMVTKDMVIEAIGTGSNSSSTAKPCILPPASPNFSPGVTQYQTVRKSSREVTDEQVEETRRQEYLRRQMENEDEDSKEDSPTYEAPAEIGSWNMYYGLSSSYDEYRCKAMTRLAGEDGYGRTLRTTARAHAVQDRWALSLSLAYEEFWGTGLLDNSDYSSLSLDFTPQYYLLQQETDHIDLMAFLTIGGEHFWFDSNGPQDEQLDLWRYGGGIGAGRTFSFGDFWFVYLYHCHRNADGDDGLTGNGELPIHRLGGIYTVGLTKKIFAQASIFYNHFAGLPKVLDSDDFEGALKVGWRSENWQFLVGYNQLFDSSDLRSWGIDCKLRYLW